MFSDLRKKSDHVENFGMEIDAEQQDQVFQLQFLWPVTFPDVGFLSALRISGRVGRRRIPHTRLGLGGVRTGFVKFVNFDAARFHECYAPVDMTGSHGLCPTSEMISLRSRESSQDFGDLDPIEFT